VTYLQIAPKSRTEIPEYADMEQEIGSAAGRINGAYGEADTLTVPTVTRHLRGFIAPHVLGS
jgi:trehalose 6-phosphate synthase